MIMTTKEKSKAFIEENAKYEVGQTVYWDEGGKPCCAKVSAVDISSGCHDFIYFGGRWNSVLGMEAQVYRSLSELSNARCLELTQSLTNWAKMTKDDVMNYDERVQRAGDERSVTL